ncbi:carboxypeptidase-like regulatory domain-containing protein [bacterium]|nr:carboxypeptidase-like regulatory domain-containing protein [bacterium]
MRRARYAMTVAAAALLVVASVTVLGGCGGGGTTAVRGGTITGRTIDGATSLGLGGVTVSVLTSSGERKAVSTTPDGAFTIKGMPAGTYTSLTVTPDPDLYGAPRTVSVTIVMPDNGAVTLSGPILVLDDFPPDPA